MPIHDLPLLRTRYVVSNHLRPIRSVWDFPRPPAVEREERRARVLFDGSVIADTTSARRVLETSHPPVIYFPRWDVDTAVLAPAAGTSYCEYKGVAVYWDVVGSERRSARAAWSYPDPAAGYEEIRDHLAFYASRVDACYLGDELATAQAGDFYGGWITSDVKGPFKGGPGTGRW